MTSALVLGGVGLVACGDGDGGGDPDAGDGGMEGGTMDGGEEDSGQDSGPEGMMCPSADDFCPDRELVGIELPACCSENGQCGNNFDMVAAAVPAVPLTGCFETGREGDETNEVCGQAFDALDGMMDGQFNQSLGEGDDGEEDFVNFAPCCTPEGICGIVADTVTISGADFTLGLGCQPFTALIPDTPPMSDAGAGDGGAGGIDPTVFTSGEAPLPFCNPSDPKARACVPGAELPGGITITEDVCASLGLNDPMGNPISPGECFDIPELGVDLPPVACGCGDIPADQIPKDDDGNPLCIPNIAANVCGCPNLDTTNNCDKDFPEYVCGCGANTPFTGAGFPCLGGLEESVCGCKEQPVDDNGTPADPADDCLTGQPEYVLGCGEPSDGPLYNTPNCLKNVPAVGGCDDVTEADATIMALPEFVCGCGDDDKTTDGSCLNKVDDAICGGVEVTAEPDCGATPGNLLCSIPPFICGCGNDAQTQANTLPCLANVPTDICGQLPLGDKDGDAGTDDPCMPHMEEFLRGCGDGDDDGTEPDNWAGPPTPLCIPFTEETVFGCREVTAQPTAEQCEAPQQLRPGLCSVDSFACGCGDEQVDENCLPNVPETICGAKAYCTIGEGEEFGTDQGSCFPGEVCMDVRGGDGGDGVGDSCGCAAGPPDTCTNADEDFVCVPVGLGARCSCEDSGCELNESCVDTNGDDEGDTCRINVIVQPPVVKN